MDNISTDNFSEIKELKKILQECLSTELNLHSKKRWERDKKSTPKNLDPVEEWGKDEVTYFLINLWDQLNLYKYGFHFWRITKIINEREGFAINIEGKDQREYFKKVYNREVINALDNFIRNIQDAIIDKFVDIKTVNEIREILQYNSLFENWYKECGIETNSEPLPKNENKLQWKGQKNQIYNVLRQLKDYDLIANSYNSLADFLIQNVTGFEDTKKETIETEFKRNKDLPKPKRIKIEPGEAE